MLSLSKTTRRAVYQSGKCLSRWQCIRGIVSEVTTTETQRTHVPLQDSRRKSIRDAKPFSEFLTDNFRRQHDYLRISITEKCNLRCLYCMPEEGVPQSPPPDLLTTPEIYLLSSIFVSQGVTKIRLTGGEPTVRKDILPLMHQIGSLRSQGLRELCLTTNGISLHRKLDSMVQAGLTGVNLSLDTLDPYQFQIMTRRKGFETVMKSIERILEMNKLGAGIKLKVNCVVMRGLNDREILPFVELGREQDIEVRFIEYMPFDGNKWSKGKMLPFQEMLDMIRAKYPGLRKVQDSKNDTSKTYEIPGFVGRLGFITSMTHNFCGTCNRLRITSDGNLKVCLFGNDEVSLRDILRKSNNGEPINEQALETMRQIEMNYKQGLMNTRAFSDPLIERELLDVIGLAVKGKKEKHAGIGELENMKNRPMILIDNSISRARGIKSNTFSFIPASSSLFRNAALSIPSYTSPLVYASHSIRTYSSFVSPRNATLSSDAKMQDVVARATIRSVRDSYQTSSTKSLLESPPISRKKPKDISRDKGKLSIRRCRVNHEPPPKSTTLEKSPRSSVENAQLHSKADRPLKITFVPNQLTRYYLSPTPEPSVKQVDSAASAHKADDANVPLRKVKFTSPTFTPHHHDRVQSSYVSNSAVPAVPTTSRDVEEALPKARILIHHEETDVLGKGYLIRKHYTDHLISEKPDRPRQLVRREHFPLRRNRRRRLRIQKVPSMPVRKYPLDQPREVQRRRRLGRVLSKKLYMRRLLMRKESTADQRISSGRNPETLTNRGIRRLINHYTAKVALQSDPELPRNALIHRVQSRQPSENRRTGKDGHITLPHDTISARQPSSLIDLRQAEPAPQLSPPTSLPSMDKAVGNWTQIYLEKQQQHSHFYAKYRDYLVAQKEDSMEVGYKSFGPKVQSNLARREQLLAKAKALFAAMTIAKSEMLRETAAAASNDAMPLDPMAMPSVKGGLFDKIEQKRSQLQAERESTVGSSVKEEEFLPLHCVDLVSKPKLLSPSPMSESEALSQPRWSTNQSELEFLEVDSTEASDAIESRLDSEPAPDAQPLSFMSEMEGEFENIYTDAPKPSHTTYHPMTDLSANIESETTRAGPTPDTSTTPSDPRSTLPPFSPKLHKSKPNRSFRARRARGPLLGGARAYSTSSPSRPPTKLTHLTPSGTAHMVDVGGKAATTRTATAVCSVVFSNPDAVRLIRANGMKKGDVLGVARVAGIMGAKKTSELVPLCHPIGIERVVVDVDVAGGGPGGAETTSEEWKGTGHGDKYTWGGREAPEGEWGRIDVSATVSCTGQTGVEMEALVAASTAALTVYDMCKAVDKGMRVEGLRVVRKLGGKSGDWIEEGWVDE